MKLSYEREDWNTTDYRWLGSASGTKYTEGVMLDISHADWDPATHWPDGFLLAGTMLVESGTAGLWKPYVQGTDSGPVFPLYNGGQKIVDPATDPDPSVAILVEGRLRYEYLPAGNPTHTQAQLEAVLGPQLQFTQDR